MGFDFCKIEIIDLANYLPDRRKPEPPVERGGVKSYGSEESSDIEFDFNMA